MNEKEWLAEQLEKNRGYLQSVAYRMLGSTHEAEDAIQAAWMKISQSEVSDIENLRGWLTTVVARVCLDMLRSRKSRREDALDETTDERISSQKDGTDPEQETLMTDSIGLALLVVLDTLTPTERLVFVLHDIFAVPFDEIAPVVERSEPAVRQIASRARRRMHRTTSVKNVDLALKREIVTAFLAASREGSLKELLAMLDPNVVFRADQQAVLMGSASEVRGADAVAKLFSGRAFGAKPALINGTVGVVVAQQGNLFLFLNITIKQDRIAEIEAVADTEQIHNLQYVVLDS